MVRWPYPTGGQKLAWRHVRYHLVRFCGVMALMQFLRFPAEAPFNKSHTARVDCFDTNLRRPIEWDGPDLQLETELKMDVSLSPGFRFLGP